VVETEPHGKAAGEVAALQKWVCAYLQVCTPDGVQEEKALSHG